MPILRKHAQIAGFYNAPFRAQIKGRMQVAIDGKLPMFYSFRVL